MNKGVVAVTGATGKIGRVVTRQLLEKGYRVKALVRGGERNNLDQVPGLKIVRGDTTKIDDLKKLIKDCKYIIHLAAVMDPALPWMVYESVNIEPIKNLLEITNKDQRLVIISSVTVYVDTDKTDQDETTKIRDPEAGDCYAKSKILGLRLIRESKKNVVTVMPSVVVDRRTFGRERTVLKGLRRWIWTKIGGGIPGGIMAAVGSGSRMMSIIDVEDTSRGIILAMEKGKAGEEYILNGQNLTAAEYLRRMGKLLKRQFLTIRIPVFMLKLFGLSPVRDMMFTSRKAKKELGFNPEWMLNE